MAAICKCPFCGFEGNHGFVGVVGGTRFYHGESRNGVVCGFYEGNKGKYRTHLELFAAEVEPPRLSGGKTDRTWAQAWRARLTGHDRTAKRLFAQWHKLSLGVQS